MKWLLILALGLAGCEPVTEISGCTCEMVCYEDFDRSTRHVAFPNCTPEQAFKCIDLFTEEWIDKLALCDATDF